MTDVNETVVRCLRLTAYLLEHYGDVGAADTLSVQVVNGTVTLYGEAGARALLVAGGSAGPRYGPRVRRQRNITLDFHGVKFNGYQVAESAPSTGFDPADDGLDETPSPG